MATTSEVPLGGTVKKGDLVRVKQEICDAKVISGWRCTTQEEQDKWREDLRLDVQAGLTLPYNDAGESKLAPQTYWIKLSKSDTYLVLRSRVQAQCGWGTPIPKCTELVNPKSGDRFYIQREEVEVVSER